MRRIIAILSLLLFLFGALVPVQAKEDLSKLPELFRHFQEHKKQASATTFARFLSLHYSGEYSWHRCEHDHSQLPFKGTLDHLHSPSIVTLPEGVERPVSPVLCHATQLGFPAHTYSFISFHDIWQPPKYC
ncbi:MAG: hypothetical protein ACE5FF_00315 [Saprospiraceae bacterium]